MFHAELDINNIVIGVSDLISDESSMPHMVLINSFDVSLFGKKYDSTTNTFSDVPLTLDQVKQNKIAQLQQAYVNSFTTFQSSALSNGTTPLTKTYPINAEAQQNLLDLQSRLIADPNKTTFYFKTIDDGTLVAHTRSQFLQLMADAETFKVQQTQHYDGKIADVNNVTDEATVNAITW